MRLISLFSTRVGQERFTWMTRVYYKDAHGCVIMFDLSNKNSFINTLKWKKDVDSKCTQSDGSPIPCMLLGNKVRHFFLFFILYVLFENENKICHAAISKTKYLR